MRDYLLALMVGRGTATLAEPDGRTNRYERERHPTSGTSRTNEHRHGRVTEQTNEHAATPRRNTTRNRTDELALNEAERMNELTSTH